MKKIFAFILLTSFLCKNNTTSNLNEIGKTNSIDTLKIESAKSNNNIVTIDSNKIDSIANRLFNLRKVKIANKNCKISMLINESTDLDGDLELDFGTNSDERFQTLFIFLYRKKTNTILYYNTLEDKYIEIEKWDEEILKKQLE